MTHIAVMSKVRVRLTRSYCQSDVCLPISGQLNVAVTPKLTGPVTAKHYRVTPDKGTDRVYGYG